MMTMQLAPALPYYTPNPYCISGDAHFRPSYTDAGSRSKLRRRWSSQSATVVVELNFKIASPSCNFIRQQFQPRNI